VPARLPGCRGYFWTFRGRFTRGGRTRVTDWAGDYNGLEPWNSRYPLFPGIVGDRDQPQAPLDRVLHYHRFWIRGGGSDACL